MMTPSNNHNLIYNSLHLFSLNRDTAAINHTCESIAQILGIANLK